MSNLLQPCKICQNENPIIYHDRIERYFQIRCENCNTHTDKFKSESAAVAAWNDGMIEVEW